VNKIKQYIKKPIPVTIYRLWLKEELEAVLKLGFIKLEDYTVNAINYCLVFEDDQKGKFIIGSEQLPKKVDSKKLVDIMVKYPTHIWKSKNDIVICVSGERHWLTDKQYFEENYQPLKGGEES
jgi:hypothetical protein